MAEARDSAGRLTTHVLDTSRGRPAAGLAVSLLRVGDDGVRRERIVATQTNADGRCDEPLMQGQNFARGRYELVFETGPYFDAMGVEPTLPRFLDDVVIRFGISEDAHYHVPLLLSPFGYSTYRGS